MAKCAQKIHRYKYSCETPFILELHSFNFSRSLNIISAVGSAETPGTGSAVGVGGAVAPFPLV